MKPPIGHVHLPGGLGLVPLFFFPDLFRQDIVADSFAVIGQVDDTADFVFQLADIAFPVVILQRLKGFYGVSVDLFFALAAEFEGEKIDQGGDIFLSFPQGRDSDGTVYKAVIGVFPELTFCE